MSPQTTAAHLDAMTTGTATAHLQTDDAHLALGLAESAACEPTDFERWCTRVEDLLGHDADGDQDTDGYSIDAFVLLWEAGRTPQQAVAEVATVVF